MDLSKLFEAQKMLDGRIIKEKGLEGEDLLDKKILALQVELGELANEWRGFKFWSENQKPNTDVCDFCDGNKTVYAVNRELNISTPVKDCPVCRGSGKRDVNPLLEEYVDCLHFILSIGNDLRINEHQNFCGTGTKNAITLFLEINRYVSELWLKRHEKDKSVKWLFVLANFISLGEQLGFTWEQIEQAYYEKNKINHERQASGY